MSPPSPISGDQAFSGEEGCVCVYIYIYLFFPPPAGILYAPPTLRRVFSGVGGGVYEIWRPYFVFLCFLAKRKSLGAKLLANTLRFFSPDF